MRCGSFRHALRAKTVEDYRSLLRSRILPTFGSVPLAKIDHLMIVEWAASMTAEGLSASRTRAAYQVLSQILAAAVRSGYLQHNAAEGVALPKMPKTEARFLDHEQVHKLADAAGDEGLLVLMLAYTGMRLGEAFALRVSRVDLLRGRITVAESLSNVKGKLSFVPPKTHQNRQIVVPRFLRQPLAERLAGRGRDDLVFTDTKGGPLRYGNWRRRVWDPAVRSAGLDGLKPHDLRHTCASLLAATGVTPKAVPQQLGHASIQITLDLYTHLFPDDLERNADALDAAATATRAHSRETQVRPSDPHEVVAPSRSAL